MVTLDDVERVLTQEDLLIADLEHGVGIAGVMGSEDAEVSEATTDVLLESATFERVGVLRSARRLGLRTEASMRFERGVDPEGPGRAADRASALIAAWSGGQVLAGTIDAGHPPERRHVAVRPSRASLLLGEPIEARDVREAFGRLRIEAEERGEDEVVVEVPGYRVDLEIEADLIEDIARVRGYDNIASTLPPVRQSGGLQHSYAFRDRVRQALLRAGAREALSLSFASADDLALTDDRDAVKVANPLAADDAFLRTSLIPGLLKDLRHNVAHGVRSVVLFEVGRTFYPGNAHRRSEGDPGRGTRPPGRRDDRHGLRRVARPGAGVRLLRPQGCGRGAVRLARDRGLGDRAASGPAVPPDPVGLGHARRGAGGGVRGAPSRRGRAARPAGRVGVAELEMAVLDRHTTNDIAYGEVPRFPPVRRDLAFVLPGDVPAGAVRDAIVGAVADLGVEATLFDVHTGPPIPEGRKSLAFAVDLRAPDRTLTDEDATRAVAAIQESVAGLGGELRAG